MDDELKQGINPADALQKKDASNPYVDKVTAMINTLFKGIKPNMSEVSKPITLHDSLSAFYLPDPDTTAKWNVRETPEGELELEATDPQGIVLAKGKLTKSGGGGWTVDKLTYTGGQTITMQLERYDPGSTTPTAILRFSALNQQNVSAPGISYREPGSARLNHITVRPPSQIQYQTRFVNK